MNTISLFKQKKIRNTPHRLAVYEYIAKKKLPVSVKDIYLSLKDTGVDQVTIYRVLESFVSASLVKKIDLQDEHTYFEVIDEKDHHHVVCTVCRKIVDFNGCSFNTVVQDIVQKSGFSQITHHTFEIFGVCKQCKA